MNTLVLPFELRTKKAVFVVTALGLLSVSLLAIPRLVVGSEDRPAAGKKAREASRFYQQHAGQTAYFFKQSAGNRPSFDGNADDTEVVDIFAPVPALDGISEEGLDYAKPVPFEEAFPSPNSKMAPKRSPSKTPPKSATKRPSPAVEPRQVANAPSESPPVSPIPDRLLKSLTELPGERDRFTPIVFDVAVNDVFAAYFASNSTDISSRADLQLRIIAAFLDKSPDTKVRIIGFTDFVGKREHNQALARKRAENVARRLLSLGIHKHQIDRLGYSTEGQATQSRRQDGVPLPNGDGRFRRVEIHLLQS